MARKKWSLGELNKARAAEIAEKFSLDPFAALLISKRISNDEEISSFLGHDDSLCDPFLLPDMELAVERINDAIFDYEKICVYGDYDCDGVTSTALLYSYLDIQGANVIYMLPDRIENGYGLTRNIIDKMKAEGVNLIVTVDNGVAAIEEAEYIRELGMDLVVTDHHLPGDKLPNCVAVVDPHRLDSDCPYRDYAGVGVAFKLCCAIEGDDEPIINGFSDLVAIGTIADIVPLTGENRQLVKLGLSVLNSDYRKPSIDALLYVAGLGDKQIASSNISFAIGPRINAAGRMGSANMALELLLSDDPATVAEMADNLNKINNDRHAAEGKILDECLSLIEKNPKIIYSPVIVIYGKGWHEGVLGIVASKLLDRYCKPVIVLSDKDGISKGSARSIEGFSMFEALSACSDKLIVYGGHAQAAGLTLKTEDIPEFIASMREYAYKMPTFYPTINVDCKINTDSINVSLLDAVKTLEPFGAENSSPLFGIYNLVVNNVTEIGDKKQHLRIFAHKEGKQNEITLIYFNTSRSKFQYRQNEKFDAIVTLEKNEWNGATRVSIIVKDTRPADIDDDMMVNAEKAFDLVMIGKIDSKLSAYATPDRPLFARIYKFLKSRDDISSSSYEYIFSNVAEEGDNICRIRIALVAMEELGLIKINSDGIIETPITNDKKDLNSAPIMMRLKEVSTIG